MCLQDEESNGHGGVSLFQHVVVAREELIQRDEVPQGFTHLLPVDGHHVVVHPVFYCLVSLCRHVLGNFTFVVRELQVQTAPVDVKCFSQVFLTHAGTFKVPARESYTPR